jgi:uncharacterized protein YndB with AHSA1/START domain
LCNLFVAFCGTDSIGILASQQKHETMTKQMEAQLSPTDNKTFRKTVRINAPTTRVWGALTHPALMKKWMFETEIQIITAWKVGSPIVIHGNLGTINFENHGNVLQFEPGKILEYSHLSSLSRLPDLLENYSVLEFRLMPMEDDQTFLTFTLRNFPTESIYKHLASYWNVTLDVLKRMIEDQIS